MKRHTGIAAKHPILVWVLVLMGIVLSCKDKEEPAPDLADTAIGTYAITSVNYNGQVTNVDPSKNYSFSVTKEKNNVVNIRMKLDADTEFSGVSLSGVKEAIVLNYKDDSGIMNGTISGGTITVNLAAGSTSASIVGRR